MTDPVVAPVVAPVVTPVVAPAVRPEHVPEKFWNAETGAVNTDALIKSYSELEKKTSTPTPVDKTELEANEKAANAALKSAGLNLDTFTAEYAEKGALSPESYAALAAAGFPESFVNQHIEGALALGDSYTTAAYTEAGGEESFKLMTEWAKTTLPAADIDAFNEGVMGSKTEMLKAVKGLREKFESATGKEPALLQGGAGGTGDTFRSQAEVLVAMRDKRWGSDTAYTADITAKIGRSNY